MFHGDYTETCTRVGLDPRDGRVCYQRYSASSHLLTIDISYLGGALIEGGSDTTSSFTNSMILALIAFPEAQRKAHEELDKVIGIDRAPEWEDLDDLPYMRALVNEVHRFRPIAPLIPRYATADCEVGI